jgi:hypothetical protein
LRHARTHPTIRGVLVVGDRPAAAAADAGRRSRVAWRSCTCTLNTTIGTLNTIIGTLNATIGTLNTAIGTLNTAIGTLNATIGILNTIIAAHTTLRIAVAAPLQDSGATSSRPSGEIPPLTKHNIHALIRVLHTLIRLSIPIFALSMPSCARCKPRASALCSVKCHCHGPCRIIHYHLVLLLAPLRRGRAVNARHTVCLTKRYWHGPYRINVLLNVGIKTGSGSTVRSGCCFAFGTDRAALARESIGARRRTAT